ncbi:MAG: PucC family protein [Burkholderiaceae bacterium]|jgi:MFS transporter, BCD family, chlorophyll transporter|nr:PucC family protein [Burkholderiaceae bacterium]
MQSLTRAIVANWTRLGPRFLPFADVATAEVPLSRLLRLALFQVSVGMALVLLVGTLNRVMIVELGVPASLVAVMVALPVLYAPLRALVGYRSDTHHCALGWRRVPFIWMGTLIQFGGLAVMPFALLVLSGGGNASAWPAWVGQFGAAIAFLLVGAGLHTTQTAGLALATDLTPTESQPRVVGLMYVMLLVGTIVSALVFGALLQDFSPARLVQVIQAAALATLVLNTVALWKQETRNPGRFARPRRDPTFREAWSTFVEGEGARRRLLAIGIGTMAFGMQDVLLEPYGGQVLGMAVGDTTWLTATLASGGLLGFSVASIVLGRGADPARMSMSGAWIGLPAFAAVLLAATTQSIVLFFGGALLIGLGAGVFSHGTLTLTMQRAPHDQAGLALGAWGAVQATAAGTAVALGGILRDIFATLAQRGVFGDSWAQPTTGYAFVYGLELLLLVLTLVVMRPLVRGRCPVRHAPAVGGVDNVPAGVR